MAFERRSPLPIGRYWLDVIDQPAGKMNDFSEWALANAQKVSLETTEEKSDETPARLFVIFNVLEPVFFPARNFGFANIATPDIKTSDDTVSKPDVKEPTAADLAGGLATFGKFVLAAAGLLLLSKFVGKGK